MIPFAREVDKQLLSNKMHKCFLLQATFAMPVKQLTPLWPQGQMTLDTHNKLDTVILV